MIRPIAINAVLNGYIVTVGCQTVVFQSCENMLKTLDLYLQHPEEMEKDWAQTALNAKHTMRGYPAEVPFPEPPTLGQSGPINPGWATGPVAPNEVRETYNRASGLDSYSDRTR